LLFAGFFSDEPLKLSIAAEENNYLRFWLANISWDAGCQFCGHPLCCSYLLAQATSKIRKLSLVALWLQNHSPFGDCGAVRYFSRAIILTVVDLGLGRAPGTRTIAKQQGALRRNMDCVRKTVILIDVSWELQRLTG